MVLGPLFYVWCLFRLRYWAYGQFERESGDWRGIFNAQRLAIAGHSWEDGWGAKLSFVQKYLKLRVKRRVIYDLTKPFGAIINEQKLTHALKTCVCFSLRPR